ncbi:universal stress protein [Pontibacter silvestris]|uniref:Universal stress protein n=1 Tax=Pontibacter silvestris TaxID=2305183 RepID=A0ABW4WUS1_9BACT|nr:universal stress protein [Pontibacter silvestris]MCC9137856.1 universal stress protein [Pontibacter silvestris]
MKTILVPTDFSEYAGNTLLYAQEVARVINAKVVLFHAFHQPLELYDAFYVDTVIPKLEQEKTKELEAYANKIRQSVYTDFALQFNSTGGAVADKSTILPELESKFHTVKIGHVPAYATAVEPICVAKFGVAFDQILKATEAYKADLVIMGMRGEGATSNAFLGRTTIAVMQETKVPVLAVPQSWPFGSIKSVVLAADLNQFPGSNALNWLRGFVQDFKAKLQVLHIFKEGLNEAEQNKALATLKELDQLLYNVDFEVFFQHRKGIAEGIQQFVQDQYADLLVLAPQRHTFLDRLLNQSVTKRITKQVFIPLLALPSLETRKATATPEHLAEEQV